MTRHGVSPSGFYENRGEPDEMSFFLFQKKTESKNQF